MSFEEEAPQKEGYLNKRSTGWPISYASRYIKIEKHFLSFYPSHKDLDKCRGLMKLRDATVNFYDDPNSFCFIIKDANENDQQQFIFSTETDEERDSWIYFIEKSISYANISEFDEKPPVEVMSDRELGKKRISQFFGRKSVKYEEEKKETEMKVLQQEENPIRRLSQFLRRSVKLDVNKTDTSSAGSSYKAQPGSRVQSDGGSLIENIDSFSDLQKMIEQQDALEKQQECPSPGKTLKSMFKSNSKKSNKSPRFEEDNSNHLNEQPTSARKSFSFSQYLKKGLTSPKKHTGSLTSDMVLKMILVTHSL
eukprot:gene6704-10869_t